MSAVRVVPSNGIDIAYETFGDASDVPVLLVMGLGGQMVAWDDEFCALLAGCGHYVIRFDNRDIGLSTHLDQAASGKPVSAFLGRRPAYLIADMAQDAAGLIEQLDVGSVHVVGVSMGGCISQALTLAHPEQVRSLTSMSSSTGSRRVGHPRLDVVATLLLRKPGKNRDEAIALSESMFRRIGLSIRRRTASPDRRAGLRPPVRSCRSRPAVRRDPGFARSDRCSRRCRGAHPGDAR